MIRNLSFSLVIFLCGYVFGNTSLSFQINGSSLFFEDIISANYSRTIWKDRIVVSSTLSYNQAYNIYAISDLAIRYRKLLLGFTSIDAYTRFNKTTPEFSHNTKNMFLNFSWNSYNNITIRIPLLSYLPLPSTGNRFLHSFGQINIGTKRIGIIGEATSIATFALFKHSNGCGSDQIEQVNSYDPKYSSIEFSKLLCGVRTSLLKCEAAVLAGQSYWDVDMGALSYPSSSDNIDFLTCELRTTYPINEKFSIKAIFEYLRINSLHPYNGLQLTEQRYILHHYSQNEDYFRIGVGVSCQLK